jgi:histidyl-tRNA synthetase
VMQVAGVLEPSDPKKYATERGIVLRAIDKLDRLGADGVRALLGAGRKDASGDFTDGAGLSAEQAEIVMGFMTAKADTAEATLATLAGLVQGAPVGVEGVQELETIADLLAAQGYGADRIDIDPSVVRGLGYYTGPVFEAELTFEILDEKGRKRQFGSVAGGGAMMIWSNALPASQCRQPGSLSALTGCLQPSAKRAVWPRRHRVRLW